MDMFIVFEYAYDDWRVVGTFDSEPEAIDCAETCREAAMEVAFDRYEFAADFNEDRNIVVRGETMWAWDIAQVWLPTFEEK
jgi:hypothetical protein